VNSECQTCKQKKERVCSSLFGYLSYLIFRVVSARLVGGFVPRYAIITPIVGSANQSRFLGNIDPLSIAVLWTLLWSLVTIASMAEAAAASYPLNSSPTRSGYRQLECTRDSRISSVRPQPHRRIPYYLSPSYVVACPTTERLSVDHFQRGGQSAYFDLDMSYAYQAPQFTVVGGLSDRDAIRRVSIYPSPAFFILAPSPFPDTSHCPWLLQQMTPVLSTKVRMKMTPSQHDSFQENCEIEGEVFKVPLPFEGTVVLIEALQDGPSEPSASYAHKIADKHFRPWIPSKKSVETNSTPTA
jgi:hypothetical protein